MSNEGYWNSYNDPYLYSDLTMRQLSIGHPKFTKIRNETDIKKSGQPKYCSPYRNEDHNYRNCPNVAGSSDQP